jgi:hypothetical protein
VFRLGRTAAARAISALLSDCAAAAGADVIRKNCRRWSRHGARIQLKPNISLGEFLYLICDFDSAERAVANLRCEHKKFVTCAEPNSTDERPCADSVKLKNIGIQNIFLKTSEFYC